jgi:hypothetical protein
MRVSPTSLGLVRNIKLCVIFLDGKRLRRTVHAAPGSRLTPDGVDMLLETEAERVEAFFPGREFRLVPLRDAGQFNFVEIEKPVAAEGAECAEKTSAATCG